MHDIRKLLAVSSVTHYRHEGRLWATEHFVAEFDLWAKMFERVRLHTVVSEQPPPAHAVPYEADNIELVHASGAFSPGWGGRLASLVTVPGVLKKLWRDLHWCDAAHVRSPSRQGLLALLLHRLRPVPIYGKYASAWHGRAHSPARRLQRKLLAELPGPAVVTVYGRKSTDPPHIHSSFTSSLREQQLKELNAQGRSRSFPEENRLVWVGRFYRRKDPLSLIRSVHAARIEGVECTLDLVGEGSMQPAAEALVEELDMQSIVRFHGHLDWADIAALLKRAKVFILPSRSKEGCPKVLVEAMAAGVPCIVTAHAFVPDVIGHGRCGLVVPIGDSEALGRAIVDVCTDEARWKRLSGAAVRWSSQLSIERIVDQYRRWMEEAWECSLPPVLPESVMPESVMPEEADTAQLP